MCKASNNIQLIHKFHSEPHTTDYFTCEKHSSHTQMRIPKKQVAVSRIYDIHTIQISSKIYKLADIHVPPYMSDANYIHIIKYLEKYFTDKTFTMLEEADDYVHLYYDGEYVNMMINNMIIHIMTS